MSREDIFEVRHTAIPAVAEGGETRAIVNRMGSQIVADFFTQMVLSGFAYHMQLGTEDAGVAATVAIDDELVTMLADNVAGQAMIPLLYEVNVGVVSTATLITAMLECDKLIVRYVSGGTAYVPANLRGDDNNSANGSFFVGPDVTAATKSAVPDSVELARKDYTEDALADTIGYPGAWATSVYDINKRPVICLLDAASVLCHLGSGTAADTTGYCILQFAQFSKSLVV